jgi:hypothetical protein
LQVLVLGVRLDIEPLVCPFWFAGTKLHTMKKRLQRRAAGDA